ncbi:MAG: hypothetical protein ACRDPR_20125 [Nocardioidaceae bacterium]
MTGTSVSSSGTRVQADGVAAGAVAVTKTYGRGPAAVTALDQVSVSFAARAGSCWGCCAVAWTSSGRRW